MNLLINNGLLSPLFFRTRGKLLQDFRQCGCQITLTGMQNECDELIQQSGVKYHYMRVSHSGINPFADLSLLMIYIQYYRKNNIDIIYSYTPKPNIYGSLAAGIVGMKRVFPTVNGLGRAFVENDKFKARMIREITCLLYKMAFLFAEKVFFQNQDDRDELIRRGVLKEEKCLVVSGSGIDLDSFPYHPLQKGNPVFLIATRLLISKGVREFCKAAELVKAKHPNAVFKVAGKLESGIDSFPESELQLFINKGIVQYLGYIEDMKTALEECTVFVFPSYYREGVPHVLLEAMSSGRAIVTCDSPGCRETIRDPDKFGRGRNGFLIPPRDYEKLAERMLWMIDHKHDVNKMGIEGRKYAEEKFDVNIVNSVILKEMGLLEGN